MMKNSEKRSLQIAAKLFLFQGIFGSIAMIIALLNGKVSIRLDVVCLFLGYGLFMYSEFWRRKALAFTVFEIIVYPILAVLMLFAPQSVSFFGSTYEKSGPFSLLLTIAWYIVIWWQYKVLSDPSIQKICN